MENLFVPYKLAVKLEEIGFDEECLAYYSNKDKYLFFSTIKEIPDEFTLAPLWGQTFDWFREKYNYHYEIFLSNEPPYSKFHYRIMQIGKYFTLSYDDFEGTYEEARLVCLEKLIELCEKN